MRSHRSLAAVVLLSVLVLAPISVRADSGKPHDDITITSDRGFTRANGVRSGRGTTRDPYVISGWEVSNITIRDTSKAVRIENNTIAGQLTLNWIGRRVLVRNNQIGDLRVNENVERTGAPTSGSITRNIIGVVGQLRHYDGRFTYNVVGTAARGARAVNFDGFNGAVFAHNVIDGYMDARLHGHHHSSGFAEGSHQHSMAEDHDMMDHTKRWHQVMIVDNEIDTINSYALAYLDTNHAANDRTAASEPNRDLNDPHVHRTRVHIMDNVLSGGGILVDVFNARDRKHKKVALGSVHIEGNRISLTPSLFGWQSGIEVREAQALTLAIEDNRVTGAEPRPLVPMMREWYVNGAGVYLDRLDRATVTISGLRVTNRTYGVQAHNMTESVQWTIESLRTKGVSQPVYYDSDSVENEPRRG